MTSLHSASQLPSSLITACSRLEMFEHLRMLGPACSSGISGHTGWDGFHLFACLCLSLSVCLSLSLSLPLPLSMLCDRCLTVYLASASNDSAPAVRGYVFNLREHIPCCRGAANPNLQLRSVHFPVVKRTSCVAGGAANPNMQLRSVHFPMVKRTSCVAGGAANPNRQT